MDHDIVNFLTKKELLQIEEWANMIRDEKRINEKKIERFISVFPYTFINMGKHRIVFKLNQDFVLKLPLKFWGLVANQREIDTFMSASPLTKMHIAEIVAYGSGWLIMEKLDEEIEFTEETQAQLPVIREKFLKDGIIINDTKPKNLRLGRNGQIVFIDYGNFTRVGI